MPVGVSRTLRRPAADAHHADGFTLVELSIALFILSIVTFALFLFVSTSLSGTGAVEGRATETSQAHEIAEQFESFLYQATCVADPMSTTSTSWVIPGDLATACSPPGEADVVLDGTATSMSFYAPSSRGSGPPAAYTEYEAMLGDPRSVGHLTVYDMEVVDEASGQVSHLGTDVTSLSFTYYDASTTNCSGDGSREVTPATASSGLTNDITSVGFSVTVQADSSADPLAYSTCVLMPNAL